MSPMRALAPLKTGVRAQNARPARLPTASRPAASPGRSRRAAKQSAAYDPGGSAPAGLPAHMRGPGRPSGAARPQRGGAPSLARRRAPRRRTSSSAGYLRVGRGGGAGESVRRHSVAAQHGERTPHGAPAREGGACRRAAPAAAPRRARQQDPKPLAEEKTGPRAARGPGRPPPAALAPPRARARLTPRPAAGTWRGTAAAAGRSSGSGQSARGCRAASRSRRRARPAAGPAAPPAPGAPPGPWRPPPRTGCQSPAPPCCSTASSARAPRVSAFPAPTGLAARIGSHHGTGAGRRGCGSDQAQQGGGSGAGRRAHHPAGPELLRVHGVAEQAQQRGQDPELNVVHQHPQPEHPAPLRQPHRLRPARADAARLSPCAGAGGSAWRHTLGGRGRACGRGSGSRWDTAARAPAWRSSTRSRSPTSRAGWSGWSWTCTRAPRAAPPSPPHSARAARLAASRVAGDHAAGRAAGCAAQGSAAPHLRQGCRRRQNVRRHDVARDDVKHAVLLRTAPGRHDCACLAGICLE